MGGFLKSCKTIFIFIIFGLVGGFFTGMYLLESYPPEIQQQFIDAVNSLDLGQLPIDIHEIPINTLMGMITALQAAGYALVLGGLGIVFSKKIGLWREEKGIQTKALIVTIFIAVLGGLAMILPDMLYFGKQSEAILNSYAQKPSIAYILGTVTYGAVIEEVMLRLFAMSLIALILNKLFGEKGEKPTTGMFVLSNIIAAVLFAAGHLPATFILLGNSPMMIARCFLLNSGLGVLFGFLYRKFGLRYAMIAHGGCHIVSKLIWILFL